MSLYVVDASAAIKWILPEPGWNDALRLQDPSQAN
jgi:predicted nucleic acid-binding protein